MVEVHNHYKESKVTNIIELPMPANLPFLINDTRATARAAVATVFEGGLGTIQQIALLSRYYKIKIWFSKELTFRRVARKIISKTADENGWRSIEYRHTVTTDTHIFNRIGIDNCNCNNLIYTRTASSRRGWDLPIEFALKWEPVINNTWMPRKKEA